MNKIICTFVSEFILIKKIIMNYDVIVIGSGPGGYVAAIRASQLGMTTAVVERSELGGICLNWGCIPTKSLMKSSQILNYARHAKNYGVLTSDVKPDFKAIINRSRDVAARMSKGIEYLFSKNKITVLQGTGSITGANQVKVKGTDHEETYTAKHIILATGARSKQLPQLQQDGKHIIGYRQALNLDKLPKSMIVVGSGAIGTELAYFYNSMGTQVRLVEFLPNILPLEDEEVSTQIARSLKKQKIKVMTNASVENVEIIDGQCKASIKTKKGIEEHFAEIVLSAVGVTPNTEGLFENTDMPEMEKGKIKTDEFYKTSIEGIYAIGDIVGGPALAHVASAEAICCVEKIAGMSPATVDYGNIPSGVYTDPEIASVGLTEKQASDAGYELKIGRFPFRASGKATAAGTSDGFVKLIYNKANDTLLGAHIVGAGVTELIAEAVSIRKLGGKLHDLMTSIHPHPSMSEAIFEAAAAAAGEAIHLA